MSVESGPSQKKSESVASALKIEVPQRPSANLSPKELSHHFRSRYKSRIRYFRRLSPDKSSLRGRLVADFDHSG